MGEPTFYFGYGSNLDAEDWAAWCRARGADPTAMVEVCSAWLLDHSMRCLLYTSDAADDL